MGETNYLDANLNFALKGGNLNMYISTFRKLREKTSTKKHDILKELAGELAEDLFGLKEEHLS
jgi:hypothetical protein